MTAPAKSLKEGNRTYLALIVAANFLALAAAYAVAKTNTYSVADLKAVFTEWTNVIPVGFAFIVATVANGQLSVDMKHRLVFLRWKDALPGHRAFSVHAATDPRIDVARLEKVCGNKVPDDQIEQNRVWYRLYKMVENFPSVLQVHGDFLLMRDYATLAALLVVVLGPVALIFVPSWHVSLIYFSCLVAQFALVRQAASTYGIRFVKTVLAEKTAAPDACST